MWILPIDSTIHPSKGNQIPHSNMAKYLGMTLDAKLWWKEHVKKKTEEQNKQTNKPRGFSPQANYTDRATAARRRS
jgi:hypothetical protein